MNMVQYVGKISSEDGWINLEKGSDQCENLLKMEGKVLSTVACNFPNCQC